MCERRGLGEGGATEWEVCWEELGGCTPARSGCFVMRDRGEDREIEEKERDSQGRAGGVFAGRGKS